MRGWLRRPAGLAFAGGLCAVIFAVAFGTKMYQESLERGPRTVPTENGPSGTCIATSQPPAAFERRAATEVEKKACIVRTPAKKDALDDRSVERKSARAMFNGIESGSNAAVGILIRFQADAHRSQRFCCCGDGIHHSLPPVHRVDAPQNYIP